MKKSDNEFVAQGAVAWREKEEHLKVMKMLEDVCVDHKIHHTTEEEWAMMSDLPATWDEWIYKGPQPDELLKIANRGNTEEIVFMVEKYAKFLKNQHTACVAYMPESVQEVIAKRNNKEEVNALIKHYGFCNEAQMVILETWPIADLLWYINYHGFADKGQKFIMENWSSLNVTEYLKRHNLSDVGQVALINRGYHEEIEQYLAKANFSEQATIKLLERGNHDEIIQMLMKHDGPLCKQAEELLFSRNVNDEINFYIKFYPISDNLIFNMFDKIDKGESADRLFFYFWHHGMPVNAEKRLINTPNSEVLFEEYVKRHPISFEAHEELVEKRTKKEVRFYIEHHGKLSFNAEKSFFRTASKEDKLFYINANSRNDGQVLNSLFEVRPIDYEVMTAAILSCQEYLKCDGILDSIDIKDVELKVEKGDELSKGEVVALFFLGDSTLFEKYVDEHKIVF